MKNNKEVGANPMFGLTESEMDMYRIMAQDFAIRDVVPQLLSNSHIITPLIIRNGKEVPDKDFVKDMVQDIEISVTLTTISMAVDYAHLQVESDKEEEDIIKHLHEKYENNLTNQFIRYGICFSSDVITEIIGQIVLELPYLYMGVIEDEDFDEDSFLEEKMEAYNNYLLGNFPKKEVDEEDN